MEAVGSFYGSNQHIALQKFTQKLAKVEAGGSKLYGYKGVYDAFLGVEERGQLVQLMQKMQALAVQVLQREKQEERRKAYEGALYLEAKAAFETVKRRWGEAVLAPCEDELQVFREELRQFLDVFASHMALPAVTKVERLTMRAVVTLDRTRIDIMRVRLASLSADAPEMAVLVQLREQICQKLKKPLEKPAQMPQIHPEPVMALLELRVRTLKEGIGKLVKIEVSPVVYEYHLGTYIQLVEDIETIRNSRSKFTQEHIEDHCKLHALEEELVVVRGLFRLVKKMQEPALAQAIKAMGAFLEVQDQASLDAATTYFEAGRMLEEVQLKPKKQSKWSTYIHSTFDVIKKRYQMELGQALILSSKDTCTWTNLVDKNVACTEQEVKTYVARRAAMALYGDKKAVDIGLELVLYALKNDPAYKKLYDACRAMQVCKSYESLFQLRRSDALLSRAFGVLSLIYRAHRAAHDPLAYIEAWQRYIEFAREEPLPLVKDEHEALVSFLFSKLKALAEGDDYISLYGDFSTKSLADFLREGNFISMFRSRTYSETREWQHVGENVEEYLVFESFLTRVLAACLYSNDQEERAVAQTLFSQFIEDDQYKKHKKNLSGPTKDLIYANTMRTLLTTERPLGPKEQKFFFYGRAADVLTTPIFQLSHIQVHRALFCRVKEERSKGLEQGEFTTFVRSRLLERFDKWYERHMRAAATNPQLVTQFLAAQSSQNSLVPNFPNSLTTDAVLLNLILPLLLR